MVYTLKQARRLAGKTQAEMAQLLNISRHTYMTIEKDPSKTTVERAIKIAKITNVPFSLLKFD